MTFYTIVCYKKHHCDVCHHSYHKIIIINHATAPQSKVTLTMRPFTLGAGLRPGLSRTSDLMIDTASVGSFLLAVFGGQTP